MNNQSRIDREKSNSQWLESYNFLSTKVEDTYLGIVVKKSGAFNVLKMINSQIVNQRFEVGFEFANANEKFIAEQYSELLLFTMNLTLPKEDGVEINSLMLESIGSVGAIYEDDTHITYTICFSEGLFALTINDVLVGINQERGPIVEKKLTEVGITDYHCSFEIMKCFH